MSVDRPVFQSHKTSNTALRHTLGYVACQSGLHPHVTVLRVAQLILKRYQHHRSPQAERPTSILHRSAAPSKLKVKVQRSTDPSSTTHRHLRLHGTSSSSSPRHRLRPDRLRPPVSLSINRSIIDRTVSQSSRNACNRSPRTPSFAKYRRHRHSSWLRSAATSSLQPKSGTQMRTLTGSTTGSKTCPPS